MKLRERSFFQSKVLGRYLHDARMRKRMSAGQMAKILGISDRFFIRKWERGLQPIPAKRLGDVVRVLDLDKEQFLEIVLADIQFRLGSLLQFDCFSLPVSNHHLDIAPQVTDDK